MEPSSLIFVAIIGVWAAYLVPHWLRRRDELAQSRTRDRFSVGLRVLPRRRRPVKTAPHRSGDAVLTSPRLVIDADGEFLYIPADRELAARAASAAQAEVPVAAEVPGAEVPVAGEVPVTEVLSADVPVVAEELVTEVPVDEHQSMEPGIVKPEPVTARAEPGRSLDLDGALAGARVAARRRAVIMTLLIVGCAASWGVVIGTTLSAWLAAPASALLVLHALASRVAGLRSRETLTLLAAQLHAAELALARPRQTAAVRAAEVVAEIAQATPSERVVRRAAAVGAETWQPVPVPPPTYTLKPAVHRPEPLPLDLPLGVQPAAAASRPAGAGQPAAAVPHGTGAGQPAAAVSRGALPRRAAEIERILALESDLDDLFEHRKAVNG